MTWAVGCSKATPDPTATDRRWAIDKIKAEQGFSEEAARLTYESIEWSPTGVVDRKGLENVIKSLTEFGMVAAEKIPPVDELFIR